MLLLSAVTVVNQVEDLSQGLEYSRQDFYDSCPPIALIKNIRKENRPPPTHSSIYI